MTNDLTAQKWPCPIGIPLGFWIAMTVFAMHATAEDEFEHPPIRYSNTESDDPVAQLQRAIRSGQVRLTKHETYGYLPSLLEALNVSPNSQVLVFSKTSLQIHRISPTNPRAIYFNDSVYVGCVPGSTTLELSANDRRLGAVFYTLDSESDEPSIAKSSEDSDATEAVNVDDTEQQIRLVRDRGQCLSCHASTRTEGVPGHLMRSIYPDRAGRPRSGAATYSIDDRTPFPKRWGGWYVTGTHGDMRHMGNVFADQRDDPQSMNVELGANLPAIPRQVRTGLHLTDHSDIVALMVLAHQTRVHNLITKANYETVQAVYLDSVMNKALGRPEDHRSESTLRRIASAGKALVDAIMLMDEAEWTQPVRGTSDFAAEFTARGPFTADGRSLRQLDLQTRLFVHPLSYLIYTDEFRKLPEPMMQYIRGRLKDALDGCIDEPGYRALDLKRRESLREILTETLPELLH